MDWTELANKHRRGDGLPKMIREPSPSDASAHGKIAIRGREQQLIDFYGGVGSRRVANVIRGVSKYNPAGRVYHETSNLLFGNIAPYTGFF